VAALDDQDFVDRSVAHVRRWLPRFAEAFRGWGLAPAPSATNFVTVGFPEGCGRSAAEADAALAREGLIVRALRNYHLPDHLRVTVGSEADSDTFLAAMGRILGPQN